ncbi:MAG: hypothetical protein HY909_26640 [Deltaproteobacteria bacterium]|nr:hypothetical protein [Deltaproteobacteria bacterium]
MAPSLRRSRGWLLAACALAGCALTHPRSVERDGSLAEAPLTDTARGEAPDAAPLDRPGVDLTPPEDTAPDTPADSARDSTEEDSPGPDTAAPDTPPPEDTRPPVDSTAPPDTAPPDTTPPDTTPPDVPPDTAPDTARDTAPDGPPPSGESCMSAIPLPFREGRSVVTGTTVGAMADYRHGCSRTGNESNNRPDRVYRLELPEARLVTVQVNAMGGTWDPVVAVRRACSDERMEVACNDDASPATLNAGVGLLLGAGVWYLFVDGTELAAAGVMTQGPYELAVTVDEPVADRVQSLPGMALCGMVPMGSTSLTFPDADDSFAPTVDLGFNLTNRGSTFRFIAVNSNGFAQLRPTMDPFMLAREASFTNLPVPSSAAPNGFVAPFWDDLQLRTGMMASQVRTWAYTTPDATRARAVRWERMDRVTTLTVEALTFEARLFETGVVEFAYCTLDPRGDAARQFISSGGLATVGVEGVSGTTGVGWGFNVPGLSPGMLLRFTGW